MASDDKKYMDALRQFDKATCEAYAVSQASAMREVKPTIGYCSYVFTRMCSHANMAVSALPNSRWARRDFDHWDISSIACHSRALMEGFLLFTYLANASHDEDTQRAYVHTMNMYDCKKRISILGYTLSRKEKDNYENEANEIEMKLKSTQTFQRLKPRLQKEILAGRRLMIVSKQEIISRIGVDQNDWNYFYNFFSQYTHILSLTFYRIELNGRNTGTKNQFDLDALTSALVFSASILVETTDQMVGLFPDVGKVRRGITSKFYPGPKINQPKRRRNKR